MDPLAHTLFGATLAEAGLKRRTRFATATLLIGANLPDVDAVAGLWGGDVELHVRRGWTHGILALFVLPLLLAGGIWLWHRWRTRPRAMAGTDTRPGSAIAGGAPQFHPRAVLALAFLAVWSHPLLDWLNTYGVRLLMPFDGRWFYGDTLFIIEPWFWLLTAAGVVMTRSSTWRSVTGWSVLALLASAVVLGTNMVPPWVKAGWCVGVLLIVLLRWRAANRLPGDNPQRVAGWLSPDNLARLALALLLVYIGVSWSLARVAESRAIRRFPAAELVHSNPAPGNPFSHRMLIVEPDRYRILAEDGATHELPRAAPDAIARAALADPSIRGYANWLRFPYWRIEDGGDHWKVHIQDLRYQGPDMANLRGFGAVTVTVPRSAAGKSP